MRISWVCCSIKPGNRLPCLVTWRNWIFKYGGGGGELQRESLTLKAASGDWLLVAWDVSLRGADEEESAMFDKVMD